MTIREVLVEGTLRLKNAFIDSPSLDASILLTEVLSVKRQALISKPFETVSESDREKYNAFLKRRINGECIAYILGRKEFWNLDFIVSPAVLVPRPDTEILVETALSHIARLSSCKLLDLCTGSGAIGLSLKHDCPQISLYCSDISEEALNIAQQNARKLLNKDTVYFIQSDLFENIREKFNIITSNPPYIPSDIIETLKPEVRKEPRISLDGGKDGLEIIKRIVLKAKDHLFPEGRLIMEADPSQMNDISELLRAHHYCDIKTHKDLSGQERVISAAT